MIKQKQTILLSGYYGFGNTGDEAILAAIISDLRSAWPEVDLCVISGNPAATQKKHQVTAVAINDLQIMITEIKRSDLVIIGGGGLFHDYWDVDLSEILSDRHQGMTLYCSIAFLTSWLNKPLMILGAGVGPLQTDKGKHCTRAVFASARAVTVRDQKSKTILGSLGLDPEKIKVTADPSFRWLEIHNQSLVPVQIDAPKPYLGIALRNWDLGPASDSWEKQVAAAVDQYLDIQEGSALLIPFQNGDDALSNDLEIASRIYQQLRNRQRAVVLNAGLSSGEISSVISRCDVLLGMRLHALIFAALNRVPFVGLIYDPKIFTIMGQLGIADYALPLDEIQPRLIVKGLENAVENNTKDQIQIQSRIQELRRKALANTQEVVRLLNHVQIASTDPAAGKDWLSENILAVLIDSVLEKERNRVDAAAEIEDLKAVKYNLQKLIDEERTARREASITYQNQISQLIADRDRERFAQREQSRVYETRISHLARDLEEKKSRINQAEKELAEIKGSRGWKLLWLLWEVRNFLLPKGSRFEGIISDIRQAWSGAFNRIIQSLKSAKNRWKRWGMSKYEFAFDQYKRARSRKYKQDLSSLRLPGRSGLVSIVLPVYNGEKFIAEAIESILAQTYQEFELILINDGSEDHTGRILDQYQEKDGRIRVIHQENRKLPLALSRGFNLAEGEFRTWTSHDNRLLPDFLERMVLSLREHPEWDMVYANQDIIDESGAPLRGSGHYRGYEWPPGSEHIKLPEHAGELNTKANNFIGGAFLYRDRVHWLLGDYSPIRFTREDYDYWMRVNALLTLKHTDFQDSIYEYRFHPDSLTHQDPEIGITRDRKNLMVFDDFRRDFFLSAGIWLIETQSALEEGSDLLSMMISSIKHAGNLILNRAAIQKYTLPDLWMPVVYVYVANTLESMPEPPPDIPGNTLKVLLCTSPELPLPEAVSDIWDICVAYGIDAEPPSLKNIRQGWLVSKDMRAVLSAVDIRLRSRHLEKIEKDMISSGGGELKISVIICTYNRAGQLADTLRSIAFQTMEKAEFEVIVVNNQPGFSDVENVVNAVRKEHFKKYPSHISVIDCPLRGLSYARNAGLSEAKGEMLYFIDDDATAEPNTLEEYWKLFSKYPDAGVIGGQILFKNDQPQPRIWRKGWEKYWSHFPVDSDQFRTVENWWEYPWGANWCARKIALKRAGGFRTAYGRQGKDFSGGEEIIAASCIKRLGYSVGITPRAVVSHHIDSSRISLRHLQRTIYAGLLTIHQAEIELRLFPESSRDTLSGLRSLIYFIRLFLKTGKGQREAVIIEAYYFILAHWRIFIRRASDSLKRLRRPLTAQ